MIAFRWSRLSRSAGVSFFSVPRCPMTALAIDQASGPSVREPCVETSFAADPVVDWNDVEPAWPLVDQGPNPQVTSNGRIPAFAESDRRLPQVATLAASPSMENCDALLVSLASRRIIVARRGQRVCLWSAEQFCKPMRAIKPGEKVFYNGQLDTVRAIAVY